MSSWIAARELSITWGDDPRYWEWVITPDSAGKEVAKLLQVCWFDVRGKIDSKSLHIKTSYASYFVFKVEEPHWEIDSALAAVRFLKEKPDGTDDEGYTIFVAKQKEPGKKGRYAHLREDGWMEVKLGDFYNNLGGDGEVEMRLWKTKNLNWKSGLIVRGIDIRPN